jgi:hypothetical protein
MMSQKAWHTSADAARSLRYLVLVDEGARCRIAALFLLLRTRWVALRVPSLFLAQKVLCSWSSPGGFTPASDWACDLGYALYQKEASISHALLILPPV